ncbi:uncharacterized protein LOC131626698 [Vicia villosa]|uniref:uncharacterized protein LOC131626698 n=1 Tax=Vicia villosa TaxID=3911 RepID=UPI00273CC495|nr:uncharacterized protein LOC131626698 [Vicia villosa]
MGGWRTNGWAWDRFGLDAAGSAGADNMVLNISEMLQHVQPVPEGRDGVIWLADPDYSFTVRSCYDLFNFYHLPRGPDLHLVRVFSLIWKLVIPNKTKFFGWRCFLDRLPTRDLLLYRGIPISSPNVCVFCETEKESLSHIIFCCRFSRLVWKDLASWIGFTEFLFVDVWSSFYDWHSFCKNRQVKPGREGIFWAAICWSLWKVRNGIIFRNGPWSVSDIIWNIKELIWRWSFIGKITRTNYNFYEFLNNPLLYFS